METVYLVLNEHEEVESAWTRKDLAFQRARTLGVVAQVWTFRLDQPGGPVDVRAVVPSE